MRSALVLSCCLGLRPCISFSQGPVHRGSLWGETTTRLSASLDHIDDSRRQELLSREGTYFSIDRARSEIEFGATARLVTELETETASESISTWLRDQEGLAMSIWDEQLIQDKGNNIYRLQVMDLQFVTLKLAPWVDVEMKTLTAQSVKDPMIQFPIFRLQSVSFDPNISLLPGMRITAESLGIVIQVVGELRPTSDGKGVSGKISFSTRGKLPPPLALLPDGTLRAASDSINDTIVQFAISSFKKGAKAKYNEFRRRSLVDGP